MIRQYELVEKVREYYPQVDEDMLNRAYVFSMRAHGSQKRASGDPYFTHPLEVAAITTELKLDQATVATALLHDIIEDTPTTREEVEVVFGQEISSLVDGVTKLGRIASKQHENRQAEDFRKFMIAMASDIRVLLVKLADRLHNMRTLHYIKEPEKRIRIARETIELYAPLAGRIGMQSFREEFEDLAFHEINQPMYKSIRKRLNILIKSGETTSLKIRTALQKALLRGATTATQITGRTKQPYSIFTKMQRKKISFEQLSDVLGFRIIAANISDCYRTLGVIHTRWAVVPGSFKDYISLPKRNGYQSIHTTIIGPERQRVEIQIRTRKMHEIAQNGIAAHWHYKDSRRPTGEKGQFEKDTFNALRNLVDHLASEESAQDFLEHTKLEMFQDQVFCFTPKGRLITLPRGGTPIDFAYAVHTDVGNCCVGVKINGNRAPLNRVLKNGDQVEILLSKAQTAESWWELAAVTGRARAAIRRALRERQREEFVSLGRVMAKTVFRDAGYDFSETLITQSLKRFDRPDVDSVYYDLAHKKISECEFIDRIIPGAGGEPRDKLPAGTLNGKPKNHPTRKQDYQPRYFLPVDGEDIGHAMQPANCCHPVPGDRIVGIHLPGEKIKVHTIDCARLQSFLDSENDWIDLAWDNTQRRKAIFAGRLRLEAQNKRGIFAQITASITKNEGDIDFLNILHRNADFFTMEIDVIVTDLEHLERIKAGLRAIAEIALVERDRGEGCENLPPLGALYPV